MNPHRRSASGSRAFHRLQRILPRGSFAITSLTVLAFILRTAAAENLGASPGAVLEFIAPTNGAVYSTLDEIPIVLRAFAPDDLILSAEVFGDREEIGTAVFCCPFCPCAHPLEGQETVLQIPVPWENGAPPPRTWQGWTNVHAGIRWLTARGVTQKGAVIEAPPVAVTVVDLSLRIHLQADGVVLLVIPQGSLTMGGFDLEVSPDLRFWTGLGPFSPGNVAAFYWDEPQLPPWPRRYYRSVYVGVNTP